MFSDEELNLAFAVVAAAAFIKGEAPGLTRVLCGRPACAGLGGAAAGAARPVVAREDGNCGHPAAPGGLPPGPAQDAPAWPTTAATGWAAAATASAWAADAPGWAAAGAPIRAAGRPAGGDGGQTRLVFAVDIAGFTDAHRDDEVQLALRRALYQLLGEAFEASGISWADCVHEDRGDGVVVVVPQGLPAVILIDPLLYQLRAALRRHNRMASEVARIGLRAAVHMGQVHRDDHGLAGRAVNHLFRLLDAPVLRTALAASGAELALIVSDHYYECVIRQRPSMIESAAFRPAAVKVKQTRDRGWIWTPPVAVDAGRAVAVKWWMTPVGAVCTMLWAGGATLIATAGVDQSPVAGLALGVVAPTGLVMAVMTTALAVQGMRRPTRPPRSAWPTWSVQSVRSVRSIRSVRSSARTARISAAEPPGTESGEPSDLDLDLDLDHDLDRGARAGGTAGGALSGG
jgi:hypothetical protein